MADPKNCDISIFGGPYVIGPNQGSCDVPLFGSPLILVETIVVLSGVQTTFDAAIQKAMTKSITLDAVIQKAQTESISFDAVIVSGAAPTGGLWFCHA